MHYVVAQHKSWLFLAFPVLRDTPSCPNIFDLLINFFPTFKYHNTCTSTLLNGQCFWRLYSSVQIPHLSYSTTEIIFIISSHTSLKGIWKSFSTSQIYKAVSSFYCQVPLGLVLDLKGTDVCLQSVKHPGLGRSRTISKGVLNIFPLCCQNVLQINCCPAIVSVFFSFLQCSNFYAFFFFSYFGALCLPSPLLFSSTDFPPSLISLLSFKPANLFLPFAHIKSLIALVTSREDHSKQRQVLSFSYRDALYPYEPGDAKDYGQGRCLLECCCFLHSLCVLSSSRNSHLRWRHRNSSRRTEVLSLLSREVSSYRKVLADFWGLRSKKRVSWLTLADGISAAHGAAWFWPLWPWIATWIQVLNNRSGVPDKTQCVILVSGRYLMTH